MINYLLPVFVGGAIGASLRFLLLHFWANTFRSVFPMGTILVNCIGCLCIGFFWAIIEKYNGPMWVKLLVITGGLGGFTTFSTYGLDIIVLLQKNELMRAAFYFILSNGLGLLCVYLGMKSLRLS